MDEDRSAGDITDENDLVLCTEDESYDKSSHLDGTIEDPNASMIRFLSQNEMD